MTRDKRIVQIRRQMKVKSKFWGYQGMKNARDSANDKDSPEFNVVYLLRRVDRWNAVLFAQRATTTEEFWSTRRVRKGAKMVSWQYLPRRVSLWAVDQPVVLVGTQLTRRRGVPTQRAFLTAPFTEHMSGIYHGIGRKTSIRPCLIFKSCPRTSKGEHSTARTRHAHYKYEDDQCWRWNFCTIDNGTIGTANKRTLLPRTNEANDISQRGYHGRAQKESTRAQRPLAEYRTQERHMYPMLMYVVARSTKCQL